MRSISAIVVSYNTRDLLRACIRSLSEAQEIIVVDNASIDGSADMVAAEFPHVRLIRNVTNRGFGAANNQGLQAMQGELALLMNSDAEAQPGSIPTLERVFDDPTVVAAGGRLICEDGSEQLSCCNSLTLWAVFCEQTGLEKLFPASRLLSPYWLNRRLDGSGPFPVAQCMGACLMFKPVERFDERFFLYCEDTELCHRLSRLGQIMFVRAAEFKHALGASSALNRWAAVARYNWGKELYFFLHRGLFAGFVCWLIDRLGAVLRVLGGCAMAWHPKGRLKLAIFWRVLFAPLRGPKLPPDSA